MVPSPMQTNKAPPRARNLLRVGPPRMIFLHDLLGLAHADSPRKGRAFVWSRWGPLSGGDRAGGPADGRRGLAAELAESNLSLAAWKMDHRGVSKAS